MSDFDQTARRLHQLRTEAADGAKALHEMSEARRRLERDLARLSGRLAPQDAAGQRRRRNLETKVEELKGEQAGLEKAAALRARELAELVRQFERYTDPKTNLGKKDASLPILLFPLRLETRWKTVEQDGQAVPQLWVRVFPDDCLVDTFESTHSEGELDSLDAFWVNWARAGGVPDQRRAAWRTLVAGSGSGRATWLIEQYRPQNRDQLPAKAAPSDVMLVVASQPSLPEPERASVAEYWGRVWKAEGDAPLIEDAARDLAAALGQARAQVVTTEHVPVNLAENPVRPKTRANVGVGVAFLEMPDRALVASQRSGWTRPPRVGLLPERLRLIAYRAGRELPLEKLGNPIPPSLQLGPDPLAPEAEQMHLDDGNLVVGAGMRWMVDFGEAERVGMAFRLTLTPEDAELGFDRLLVLGVRLGADHLAGKGMVEQLFLNHQRGTAGFAILPQGTPTNNTEAVASGHSEREDSDESYPLAFDPPPAIEQHADPAERVDGQWLADMLGIDLSTFDRTAGSRGRDTLEARAMNTVLWPATWGYLLETMLKPVLDDDTIASTRWFFTDFVTGRGTIPAIRIADQPYGILPATAWSRMAWLEDDAWRPPIGWNHPQGFRGFLLHMDALLKVVRRDWVGLFDKVSFVGKAGDPHQLLLDVVGLTPGSIEFYHRYAESLEELSNRLNLEGFGGQFLLALIQAGYTGSGMTLLKRLGYQGGQIPEVLEKFFVQKATRLEGAIIDDQALSETQPVRIYTENDHNYLQWLIDAARNSFETLRREEGFIDHSPPTALLYLLLRYALEQGYWDAGIRLFEAAGILSASEALTARLDPSFIHVADRKVVPAAAAPAADLATSGKPIRLDRRSESRYEYLYRFEPAITGALDRSVADFIPGILGANPATRYLDQQLTALARLVDTPTARLERLLAEHLDLCTYRLDAWRAGHLHYALASLRYGERMPAEGPAARQGIYLGTFGWLENLKSENKQLTPVKLPADLQPIFASDETEPLVRDNTNGGFIHAPSLNQATAAAILRNGYISNATPSTPNTLAVNLSSARVRTALGVIEGIRNGQKLGALLGYQLERGLHDRHNLAEVDQFVFKLRKAFPLVADHLKDTQSAGSTQIEAIEARNVVDGLALVSHIATTGQSTYPFGESLPPATAAEAAVINAEVDRIRDIHDAVADLATAESVYQAVLGNVAGTAQTLDAYAQGGFPPEPEVVRTPRTGLTLTHRMGLQLEAGRDHTLSPNVLSTTPRSQAEPALNTWLDGQLPAPDLVFCQARYFDPVTGSVAVTKVTQAHLGLQPLDLLYVASTDTEQAMTELDDRVVHTVMTAEGLRPDTVISVDYAMPIAGEYSMFEVGALLKGLRTLVLKSKPLTPGDVTMPNEASSATADALFVDEDRITAPLALLAALVLTSGADDLTALKVQMEAPLADAVAFRSAILDGVDGWLDRFQGFAARAWTFGIPVGVGAGYEWRRQRFQTLLKRVREQVDRWQEQLDEADALLDSLSGLADDTERFTALRRAESLVSASYTEPDTVANHLTAVEAKWDLLEAKRVELAAVLLTSDLSVRDLLTDIRATFPLDAFDHEPLDVTDQEDEVVRFAGDLKSMVDHLYGEAARRRDAAQSLVDQAALAAGPRAAADLLVTAGKAIFGEDFRVIPEWSLPAEQGVEWQNALADEDTLLAYLTLAKPAGDGRDFPVDDWMHGVARVREKVAAWEQVVLISMALGGAGPALHPVQLPYRPDDRWLALPFPPTTDLEGERLLYTACYPVPFDRTTRQCGLLFDEWTEVIPNQEETTGLAFHYDRPNSEPPQALLLAISPALRGAWQWQDLVDTLYETLDEARLRAVEPAHVDTSAYARFLPAALMAATRHPITIALNLAINNNVMALLETPNG